MEQDSEYLLLNSINELTRQKADISQRDLARAINLSLGMTNVLLKRLSQKGYILVQKVSARKVSYVLTPAGVNELAGRTYRYLKRTMKKVVNYKETIMEIARDARSRGFSRLALLGKSDLDFIIEYAATSAGLEFTSYQDARDIGGDTFVFVSESFERHVTDQDGPEYTLPADGNAVAHVYDLLSKG